jgi:hypothetical protein
MGKGEHVGEVHGGAVGAGVGTGGGVGPVHTQNCPPNAAFAVQPLQQTSQLQSSAGSVEHCLQWLAWPSQPSTHGPDPAEEASGSSKDAQISEVYMPMD